MSECVGAGISEHAIDVIRTAFKMLFRNRKTLAEVHEYFDETCNGVKPMELAQLLQFIEAQRAGRLGRAREVVRDQRVEERKAA